MSLHRSEHERELVAAAERLFPAGTRGPSLDLDHKFVVREARGSRLWDCSGNEYIDYLLGSGPHVLGHAHPAVLDAVAAGAAAGTSHLVVGEAAIGLGEVLCELVPCAEQVSFHSTGSDATFFALRLARAVTGRDRVLKFDGAFHGMHDYALMSTQWNWQEAPYPTAVPDSHGIPTAIDRTVLVAPFNDLESTADTVHRHRDDLAAIIVEPMQRTIVPAPGFLEGLRRLCDDEGVILIFDEVVTGFRLALGGAQEHYGVVPDLCALGKTISGGLPLGVLCGRSGLMEVADPVRRISGEPFTMQTGTFSSNPVCMHVAAAVIEQLRAPGFHRRLNETGEALMAGLRAALAGAGLEAQVLGEPSAFNAYFTPEPVTDHRSALRSDPLANLVFTDALLEHGVLRAHEKFFVSAAHDAADVAATIEAFHRAAGDVAAAR